MILTPWLSRRSPQLTRMYTITTMNALPRKPIFHAHIRWYHSTLGSRVIKKKQKNTHYYYTPLQVGPFKSSQGPRNNGFKQQSSIASISFHVHSHLRVEGLECLSPFRGSALVDERPANAAVSCRTSTFGQKRYRGTSLIRKRTPLGPYRRHMPRILGWS